MEDCVFELESGGTGFMIAIAIHNMSYKILRPREARLAIPWPESNFRWLENPISKLPREYTYTFPRYGPEGTRSRGRFEPSPVWQV